MLYLNWWHSLGGNQAPPQRTIPMSPSAIEAQPIQLIAERRSFRKIAEHITLKKSTPALSKVKSRVVFMPLLISVARRMIAEEVQSEHSIKKRKELPDCLKSEMKFFFRLISPNANLIRPEMPNVQMINSFLDWAVASYAPWCARIAPYKPLKTKRMRQKTQNLPLPEKKRSPSFLVDGICGNRYNKRKNGGFL